MSADLQPRPGTVRAEVFDARARYPNASPRELYQWLVSYRRLSVRWTYFLRLVAESDMEAQNISNPNPKGSL